MTASAKDAADDVLARARSLLDCESHLSSSVPQSVPADLHRMSLAMGMAALDTYFHWKVRQVDLASPLPKALHKLEVPFGDLVDSSKVTVQARRSGKADRPIVRARNVLNQAVLGMTFQTSRGVETAMSLMGKRNYWQPVAAAMPGAPSVESVKADLNRLANERNKIVHEGDLRRLLRPQRVTHQDRDVADIRRDLDWIENLVGAFDGVI